MRPARYVSPSSSEGIRKKAAFSALTCAPLLSLSFLLRARRKIGNIPVGFFPLFSFSPLSDDDQSSSSGMEK